MKNNRLLIVVFLFFIITRLLPYLGNTIPTGYDAGIYLRLLKTAPNIPSWLEGSYHTTLFYVLTPIAKLLPDPSVLLIPLQFISAIFLFLAFFWSIKTIMNKNQRLFAIFLFAISAIQFRMYWFYYVKNMFALGFLLLFLGAINRKKYWLSAVFGILVGLTHLPTFFILAAICFIEFVIHPNKIKIALIFAISLCITLVYNLPVFSLSILPYFKPFLEANRIVQPLAKADWGGTFYDFIPSLSLMLVYLCLPVYHFFKHPSELKEFSKTPYFSGLIATSVIVIGQFFFYRRFIPVWDIFVIISAGYSVRQILSVKYFYLILTSVFIIFFIFKTGGPLINQKFLSQVKNINNERNADYILSTAKEDTAWLMGYTDKKIVAWDFGGYDIFWNDKEWNEFFNTDDPLARQKLIKKLPAKTYIFIK